MTDPVSPLLMDFHFLRPEWLWLLPVAVWVVWQLRRAGASSGGWQQLIDPPLLKVLRLEDTQHSRSVAPWLAGLLVVLGSLGLAGPSWERLPEPVHQKQDALIIALSLHESMLASDVQPTRLERARFEIRDILAGRREGISALIVYSADAHVVTPLTDDARTIDAMLPVLEPAIMPSRGDNPLSAIGAAAELLKGAGLSSGRLLMITDRFPESIHAAAAKQLGQAGLQLSMLAVGTDEGSPITLPGGGFLRNQDGSILVPAMNAAEIRAGVQMASGRFSELTAAGADLAYLIPEDPFADIEQQPDDLRLFDNWLDRGPWLVLLMLPFAALGFRRGWLFLLPMLLMPVPHADALEWDDLWLRPDQQAARARNAGDTERAAALFEDSAWKGTTQFENGDFESSAESFAAGATADDAYNRGNALAHAGQLAQAIEAYQNALDLAPDMADAAANKALLEELLKQQQQQQDQPQSGDEQQSGDQGEDNQRDSKQGDDANGGEQTDNNSEQSSDNGTDENSESEQSETSPTENPEDGEPQDQETSASDNTAGEEPPQDQGETAAEQGDAEQQSPQAQAMAEQDPAADAEQQQAVEQWLRQVPDRPGELLRRKFEYEYLLRQQAEQE